MNYKVLLLLYLLGIVTSCKGHDKTKTNNIIEKDNKAVVNKIDSLEIWQWRSEDKNQQFTIKIIKKSKDSLYAQYCAVYNNGEKLDCDFEQNVNIRMSFNRNKNSYFGNFSSFFSSKVGTCSINIVDNNLVWTILKAPNGEYYAPDKCILTKKATDNSNKVNNYSIQPSKDEAFLYNKEININNVKYERISTYKIVGLEEFACGEDDVRYIPIFKKAKFDVMLVPQDCGDFPYRFFLLTISDNRVIDNLYAEGEWYEPESKESTIEKTNFKVDKNYTVFVNTNGILKLYTINSNGEFIEKNK